MCMCKALSEQKCACVEKMEYSDSESESDRAVSAMISGLETGSGQASNAESTIPDNTRGQLYTVMLSHLKILMCQEIFQE